MPPTAPIMCGCICGKTAPHRRRHPICRCLPAGFGPELGRMNRVFRALGPAMPWPKPQRGAAGRAWRGPGTGGGGRDPAPAVGGRRADADRALRGDGIPDLCGAEQPAGAAVVGGGGQRGLGAGGDCWWCMLVPAQLPAAALAVGGAMLAMAGLRAMHPPAGAVALLVVLTADPAALPGPVFALYPVAEGAALLVLCGVLWNRLTGRVYPFRQARRARPARHVRCRARPPPRPAARRPAGHPRPPAPVGQPGRRRPWPRAGGRRGRGHRPPSWRAVPPPT